MIVGYIGLGAMGRPMAANLARSFTTRVWNRTSSVASDHARGHGTVAVGSLAELAGVDVVCSCLPTDAEVAAVADELGPLLADGAVWLDHTSGDPAGAREIAQRLAGHGVGYLDAPVSGGTDGAAAATLAVMVGGDAQLLEQVTPVLDAVSAHVVHLGDVGAGMAVKAVNQMLLATHLWVAAEGLTMLAAAGVSPAKAIEVINSATGRSAVTEKHIPERALTGAYPKTFALRLIDKDVALASGFAHGLGVATPLLDLVRDLTDEAAASLDADADHVEIVRYVEQRAGVQLR